MAPKTHHETYLTEARKMELGQMLDEKGIEHKGVAAKDLEWIDRAVKAHWKLPTNAALKEMHDAEPRASQKRRLITYAIHSAREHLGEPVGQKHEA
jgi:hypothetical protein